MGQSSYKKTYFLPSLECSLEIANTPNSTSQEKENALDLLRHELNNELRMIRQKHFPELDQLTENGFDEALYQKTKTFIKALRKMYNNKYNAAYQAKNAQIAKLTSSDQDRENYLLMQNLHRNDIRYCDREKQVDKNSGSEW